MIYNIPKQYEPIKQGDIFLGIPKVEIEFAQGLPTIVDDSTKIPWDDIVNKGEITPAVLPVFPVPAIVISQDCDARREADITLCEIKEFCKIETDYDKISSPPRKVKFLTRQCRINLKWFYLPPDAKLGFDKAMAVDFLSTINVPSRLLKKA